MCTLPVTAQVTATSSDRIRLKFRANAKPAEHTSALQIRSRSVSASRHITADRWKRDSQAPQKVLSHETYALLPHEARQADHLAKFNPVGLGNANVRAELPWIDAFQRFGILEYLKMKHGNLLLRKCGSANCIPYLFDHSFNPFLVEANVCLAL